MAVSQHGQVHQVFPVDGFPRGRDCRFLGRCRHIFLRNRGRFPYFRRFRLAMRSLLAAVFPARRRLILVDRRSGGACSSFCFFVAIIDDSYPSFGLMVNVGIKTSASLPVILQVPVRDTPYSVMVAGLPSSFHALS